MNPLVKALEDFSFLDVYYSENLTESNKINNEIVLINIEHNDRRKIVQLLKRLVEEDAKVIGVDVIFKDLQEAVVDSSLAKVLGNEKMVLSYVVVADGIVKNHDFLKGNADGGYANFSFDNTNSVIREFQGMYIRNNKEYHSFSKIIVEKALSKDSWKKFGFDEKLQTSRAIRYFGDQDRFLTFGHDEFMQSSDRSIVKDKIVLLGYMGTPIGNKFDIEDKHFTPLNTITSGKSIPDMYGVVIHANVIAMLLNNDLMHRLSNFWIVILCLVLGFFASLYFIWLDKRLKISYRTVRKMILFAFAILLVGLTLWLFKKGVVLKSAPIIVFTFFCAGFVKYYKHLVRYVNTKRKFRSYLK